MIAFYHGIECGLCVQSRERFGKRVKRVKQRKLVFPNKTGISRRMKCISAYIYSTVADRVRRKLRENHKLAASHKINDAANGTISSGSRRDLDTVKYKLPIRH